MRRMLLALTIGIGLPTIALAGHVRSATSGPQCNAGLQIGYLGGAGVQVNGTLSNFAEALPVSLRAGIAYARTSPGDPLDARRVFINDATNGTPETDGHLWDIRLDLVRPVHIGSLPRTSLLVGARYSRFTAHFLYVGGNEDFVVNSNAWGLGAGLQSLFAIGSQVDLALSTGLDYYFPSALYGHDTWYNPDDQNVHPREGYTYSDADASINQPRIELRVLLGLNYNF